MFRRTIFVFVTLAAVWELSITTAHGTTLIFTQSDGSGFGDYATLPQGYGNRVVQATQDGFAYGLDGGITPNIVTVYNQPGMPLVRTWDGGAGDLPHFITTGGDTGAWACLSSIWSQIPATW